MAPSPTLAPLPPEQAVRFLEAKGRRLGFDWRDVWQEEHAIAFTVAKMMQADLLGEVHGSLVAALKDGQSYQQWAANITPLLQAKGWWGRAVMTDPKDGVDKVVQLGSPRRLRIIYDTNVRMAQAAGQWERIEAVKAHRPYIRYAAVKDARTRPEHLRWHGTILPVDDPWWDTHSPPCGWRCRCTLQQLSASDLTREGWTVSEGPPPDSAPPQTYINTRTGEQSVVPDGVDPGFGYHKGKAARQAAAARRMMDALTPLPPQVAAEVITPVAVARSIQPEFAEWVQAIATAGRGGNEVRAVGVLAKPVLDRLAAAGIAPTTAAITIRDQEVIHLLRDVKKARGQALAIATVQALPMVIAQPAEVFFDTQDPALLYVIDSPPAGVAKFVIRVEFPTDVRAEGRRGKITTNAVRTGGLVQWPDLVPGPAATAPRRYDPIFKPEGRGEGKKP